MRHHSAHGQTLLLVALFLPGIIGLWLLLAELAWRTTTVQAVTDALRAASRSAVQTFDYAAFAEDRLALAEPEAVIAVAQRLTAINLSGISGLVDPPDQIAQVTHWNVLPTGGRCVFEPNAPPMQFTVPALCGHAEIVLRSPLGFTVTLKVFTADTLD